MGRQPTSRSSEKACKDVIVEVGEEVQYRVSDVDTGSLDGHWESGSWLGIRWTNMEHHIGTAAGVIKSYTIERKPLEDRWSKEAVEAIVGTPWRPQPTPADTIVPRVLPPLPADKQLRNHPRPREPEVRAPLRPRISKHDLTRWGFTEGCLRCRQMRQGNAIKGSKHSEKCRQRIETEMRRENDPRVKRAEDAYTYFEAEKMQAQEAINARRATEATRRGGGECSQIPLHKLQHLAHQVL